MHHERVRSTRHHRIGLALAIFALGLAASAPVPAAAEGFFDLYFGAGFPENGDVDVASDGNLPALGFAYSGRRSYETSPSIGLRGGYWFEGATPFLGLGLDLSYYRAFEDTKTAPLDIYALPLTPLLMLRVPIASTPQMPGGRVQPYAAVGPGLTISVAHADLSEAGFGTRDFTDASFDVGLDVRGGLAVQLGRRVALFGEYRYTRLRPEYEDEVDNNFGADPDVDIEPDLDTHHLALGVSFRF